MFRSVDRIPVGPAPEQPPAAPVRPWALRRMAPYLRTVNAGIVATGIAPATQIGVGPDGEAITAKHRRSNVATEGKTATSTGDGDKPGLDEDHAQDTEQD
ncbi:hypothetical protein Acsp04_60370 [Actinomadura sp. NBRC 104425]|uniref:putative ATP-grasp-modified RiPP n=1 Tax=Actinomadura sp. NBRC 104425 TaxID=3032204 RepID=UPI0024A5911E|nr:putative ATP-grasp-modified RiPP [Actinomadura sp. NBRC 104425]GLZ15802.1 hypothetical protein Acsp04_60370 [Actinomadura sp. NBRC 104425]